MSRKIVDNSIDSEMDEYLIYDPPEDALAGSVVDPGEPPDVSFCIPTLNDEATIERMLDSISKQRYSGSVEIVIADGGSTDRTVEIAHKYGARVERDDGPVGSARQTALRASSGEIIAQFDADIILPHQDWLLEAVSRFNYGDHVSTVWPRNVAPPGAAPLTRLYFGHWNLMMEHRIRTGRGFFGGGNALFRRECLEAAGGIDGNTHWGEDFVWAGRLYDEGYSVVYHRDPIYHDTMRSLATFTRKQFTGAETFTNAGFGLMGLRLRDVLYEQFVLGTYGMIKGLLRDREPAWFWYPPYIGSRVCAYGYTYVKNRLNDTTDKYLRREGK